MDGYTRQAKIKAYINPQIVNRNFFNAAWNCFNNQNPPPNSNKILINPNFKRSDSTSINNKSRQSINHVHINPNFLNPQKIGGSGGIIENHVNKSKAVIESVQSDPKLESYSINLYNNKTKINIKVKKEEGVKNVGCSSKISCDSSKNSLYSWHKMENHKASVRTSEESALNKDVLNQTKLMKNQQSNRFKFVKGKKNNQTPVKTFSPLLKRMNLVYASRTKIINKASTSSSVLKKNKLDYINKRKMLLKRRLQLLRLKSYNGSKISPTMKIAASLRSKYKYTNKSLIKNKFKHVSVKSLKYKLDKRKLPLNIKMSVCNSRYKIENLFPNKYRISPWSPRIWRNPSALSWKRKVTEPISYKNMKLYPNRTVVKIGGILYKSSQSKLTRTKGRRKSSTPVKEEPKTNKNKSIGKGNHIVYVRGEKFMLDRSGKSLKRLSPKGKISVDRKINIKRIDIGGVTYLPKSNNILIRTNTHHARYVVNHAKQRSIALLSNLRKRNYMPCMIFSRLGKCARQEKGLCVYTHDKKNIALCKKFLKGECSNKNCPLSHDLVQEKMATCHFFLNGCCNNENCPYLHVKVNSKAPICKDFIQGFCDLGQDCTKRHVNLCPEFDEKGKCRKGDKCLYPHTSKSKKKTKKDKTWSKSKGNSPVKKEKTEQKGRKQKRLLMQDEAPKEEGNNSKADVKIANREFIPKRIKLDNLPCFIPLDSSSTSS